MMINPIIIEISTTLKMGENVHVLRTPLPVNCPSERSKKYNGVPATTRRIRYGTRKTIPPFLNATIGNFQTFPSPMVSPRQEKRKSHREDHESRDSWEMVSEGMVSWRVKLM